MASLPRLMGMPSDIEIDLKIIRDKIESLRQHTKDSAFEYLLWSAQLKIDDAIDYAKRGN